MFAMLRQFFAMFSMLFSAGEKGASTLDLLAGAGEHHARSFNKKAELSSKKELALLEADLEHTLAKIKADAPKSAS